MREVGCPTRTVGVLVGGLGPIAPLNTGGGSLGYIVLIEYINAIHVKKGNGNLGNLT